MRLVALLVALLGVLSSCGNTQKRDALSNDAPADSAFVQAFIGNCVQTFPDVSKIDAAAVAFNWKHVTDPAILKALGPRDATWKAYALKYDGERLMLAVSTNPETKIRFCTIIGQPTSIDPTREKLVELLKADTQQSTEENGQRYHIYKFDNDERPTFLSFIDAVPMGMKMLNASTMIVPKGKSLDDFIK